MIRNVIVNLLYLLLAGSGAGTAGAQPLFEDFVAVQVVQRGDAYEVEVENLAHFDVTVTLDMKLTNLATTDSLPMTVTLLGKQKLSILRLNVLDRGRNAAYTTAYNFVMGNRHARHDSTYLYHLPYRDGTTHRVTQSYFGRYSHDEDSVYAVDFSMKPGTPVCAARDGVVVGLYDDSDQGGPHEKYKRLVNYILIRHRDRTLGAYHHLQKNGVKVRIGQSVRRGEVIGYSGNTGFSFAPHLHFEVFKARDGKHIQSLPVLFETREGILQRLEEGRAYTAKP